MSEAISHAIFDIFGDWRMAVFCVLIAIINLFISRHRSDDKKWPRRLKAFNWIVLAFAFAAAHITTEPVMVIRSWFRLAFGLLVISELAYHGDAILEVYWLVKRRIKKLSSAEDSTP